MILNMLATVKVDDITRTRSSGRPVNTHVTPARAVNKPDYEKMKRLVHDHVALAREAEREPAS